MQHLRRCPSVDSNDFTGKLNYLESTLTKNRGRGAVMVNYKSDEGSVSRTTNRSQGSLSPRATVFRLKAASFDFPPAISPPSRLRPFPPHQIHERAGCKR